MKTSPETGAVNPRVISNVLLAILTIGFGSVMLWALINYNDQKNNTDSKIDVAVSAAKKAQTDEDEKKFLEREKAPYVQFVGPDDLGRVSFNYPKTWSVYVGKSGQGNGSAYEAYLHPGVVPGVGTGAPYATRVVIENQTYEKTLESYQALVKKGDLKSSPITVGGFNGIRLDGNFSKTVQGSLVVFKIRDKTLTLATDATTFRTDFDTIILASLSFNP